MVAFFRYAGFCALALGLTGATTQTAFGTPVAAPVAPARMTTTTELTTSELTAIEANGPVAAPAIYQPDTSSIIERLPEDSTDTPAQPELRTDPVPEAPEAGVSLAELVRRNATSTAASSEIECLAGAVFFESKGEPLAGQLAVARVIMNRAKLARFARTYCGVIRQSGQFSFMHGGQLPQIARNGAQWRTAVAIAQIAAQGLATAPAEGALYFHARRVAPGWRMTRVASVGNHIFYR